MKVKKLDIIFLIIGFLLIILFFMGPAIIQYIYDNQFPFEGLSLVQLALTVSLLIACVLIVLAMRNLAKKSDEKPFSQ